MAGSICSGRSNSCNYSQLLVEEIVSRYGVPTEILSYRQRKIISIKLDEGDSKAFGNSPDKHNSLSSSDRWFGGAV